ncbi:MAG: hypothetical protein ACRD0A_20155 [Acidimicrobiales bacterium]
MANVRRLTDHDRPWLRDLIERLWGLPVVSSSGVDDRPEVLDGFVAERDGERVGAATFVVDDAACEVRYSPRCEYCHGAGSWTVTCQVCNGSGLPPDLSDPFSE